MKRLIKPTLWPHGIPSLPSSPSAPCLSICLIIYLPRHSSHLCQDPDSISQTFLEQFVLVSRYIGAGYTRNKFVKVFSSNVHQHNPCNLSGAYKYLRLHGYILTRCMVEGAPPLIGGLRTQRSDWSRAPWWQLCARRTVVEWPCH